MRRCARVHSFTLEIDIPHASCEARADHECPHPGRLPPAPLALLVFPLYPQRWIMAEIVVVGTSEAVITTRRAILERAGHQVTLARDLREVIAGCEQGRFDVVILGQSLPSQEKHRVSDTVSKLCPGVKI